MIWLLANLWEAIRTNSFPQEAILHPDDWAAYLNMLKESDAVGWALHDVRAGDQWMHVGILCDQESQPRVTPFALIAVVLTAGADLSAGTMVKQVDGMMVAA